MHWLVNTVSNCGAVLLYSSRPHVQLLEWIRDAFYQLYEHWLKANQKLLSSPFPEGFVSTAMMCSKCCAVLLVLLI